MRLYLKRCGSQCALFRPSKLSTREMIEVSWTLASMEPLFFIYRFIGYAGSSVERRPRGNHEAEAQRPSNQKCCPLIFPPGPRHIGPVLQQGTDTSSSCALLTVTVPQTEGSLPSRFVPQPHPLHVCTTCRTSSMQSSRHHTHWASCSAYMTALECR